MDSLQQAKLFELFTGFINEAVKIQVDKILSSQKEVKAGTVDLDGLIAAYPCFKKSTIYKKVSSNQFPFIKDGTKLLFDLKEVEKYLQEKSGSNENLESSVATSMFLKSKSKRK